MINIVAWHVFNSPGKTDFERANAAPVWQARSFGWRSRALVAACPLEGLVRRSDRSEWDWGNLVDNFS
jgi:hypothetical protein